MAQEISGDLHIENNFKYDLDTCLPQDYTLVNEINIAGAKLNNSDVAYFNVNFSPAEEEALKHIRINSDHFYSLYHSEVKYLLPRTAKKFVKDFTLTQEDKEYAPIITDLIIRIVRSIISAAAPVNL